MNNIGQRLRALRAKYGITQDELSKRIGFVRNYISLVENGRKPSRRFVRMLETLEQAPAHYFEQLSVPVVENLEFRPCRDSSADAAVEKDLRTVTTREIPLLTWAEAGKAQAWEAASRHEGFIGFDVRDAKAVAVQLRGDSMAPLFPQGMIAIVYPGWEAKTGDLVIARLKDETVIFKRFHIDGDRFTFISLNPMYPPLTVEKSEVEKVMPVGGTFQSHL